MAETSLHSPSARGAANIIWSADLLAQAGSPRSSLAVARPSDSEQGLTPRFHPSDEGEPASLDSPHMGAMGTPGASRRRRSLLDQLAEEEQEEIAEAQPCSDLVEPQSPSARAVWKQQEKAAMEALRQEQQG
jgi:hypothetical protein